VKKSRVMSWFSGVAHKFLVSVAIAATGVMGTLFFYSGFDIIRTREERHRVRKLMQDPIEDVTEKEDRSIKEDLLEVEKRLIDKGLISPLPPPKKAYGISDNLNDV